MGTTITVRTGEPLRRELEERATAQGKSLSEVVREILENAVAQRPVEQRAGHLRGDVTLPRRRDDAWRRELEERNRRP